MSKKINILIIDDDENTLASLRTLLEEKGYNVATQSTPSVAIEHIRNNVVHIVIIDITMRHTDAFSTLSIIKELSSITQIIVTSAYATIDKVITSLENGANDFILKPFNDLEHVVSIVEESEKKLIRWQDIIKQLEAF